MQSKLLQMVVDGLHVSDAYGLPRVALRAKSFGLRRGWSPDLATAESDGKPWDFSKLEMGKRAIENFRKTNRCYSLGA